MCEPTFYNEISEFRGDLIDLNQAILNVENTDTSEFELYAKEIKFVGGLHIDRQRNIKELIEPYKNEYKGNYTSRVKDMDRYDDKIGDIGLEFHLSKLPMKFTELPFTLVLDLHFKSPLKLNLKHF